MTWRFRRMSAIECRATCEARDGDPVAAVHNERNFHESRAQTRHPAVSLGQLHHPFSGWHLRHPAASRSHRHGRHAVFRDVGGRALRPVRRGVLAWASVLGAISIPAAAQFGISIVSDPGVYSRMATDLAQAIREYQAIITLYQLSQQAYANMVRAATNITTKNVWMPASTAWTYPSATNTYGTTAGWTQTINSGLGAVPAWSSSAISLQNYNPIWPSLSAGQQTQFGRRYGSIELTDSAATNSMNQVGVVRGNASTTDAAIARLEADSMSNNPALNTEVGVLNQVSAAGVINARQQQ